MTHAERVADPPVTREPGSTGADFDAFFAATYDRLVRALAVTIGDVHLGADCIQEAMVRAYLRWDDVRGYANREGWVFRVGLNLARSRARKLVREFLGGRRGGREPVAPPQQPPLDAGLVAAVQALPRPHREVLVLRFLLDWSVEATAEVLGIAPGTVKSRTARALDQLRDVMEEDDVDRHPTA